MRVILVDDAPTTREVVAGDGGDVVVELPASGVGPETSIDRLTSKEREVLALVAEGHSNDRIAARLGVTARTVESHTSRIYAKLGLEADPMTHRRVLAVLAHLRCSSDLSSA